MNPLERHGVKKYFAQDKKSWNEMQKAINKEIRAVLDVLEECKSKPLTKNLYRGLYYYNEEYKKHYKDLDEYWHKPFCDYEKAYDNLNIIITRLSSPKQETGSVVIAALGTWGFPRFVIGGHQRFFPYEVTMMHFQNKTMFGSLTDIYDQNGADQSWRCIFGYPRKRTKIPTSVCITTTGPDGKEICLNWEKHSLEIEDSKRHYSYSYHNGWFVSEYFGDPIPAVKGMQDFLANPLARILG